MTIPGQGLGLQVLSVAILLPTQLFPPWAGKGASQFLDLVLLPVPHVTLHTVQPNHTPQPP